MANSRTFEAQPQRRPRSSKPIERATTPRVDASPNPISTLQQSLGNQAIQRLVRSGTLSAEIVQAARKGLGNQAIQRLAATQPQDEESEPALGQRIRAQSGRGSQLQPTVQQKLERGLGADLSGVRVHTDGEADHLARSVNATAFTTGSDIFFRASQFKPNSPEGLQTLAHEAVHTVQQASGPVAGTPAPGGVAISDPGDQFERAAEAQARNVLAGGHAPTEGQPVQRTAATPHLQRQVMIQRVGPARSLMQLGADYQNERAVQNPGLVLAIQALVDVVAKFYRLQTAITALSPADAPGLQAIKVRVRDDAPASPNAFATITPMDYAGTKAEITRVYNANYQKAITEDIPIAPDGTLAPGALAGRMVKYDETSDAQSRTKVTIAGGRLLRNEPKGGTVRQIRDFFAKKSANPDSVVPVDTAQSVTHFSGVGFEIFVASPAGDLHMASHKVGSYHHSSLLAGGNVSMAGEMKVTAGTIVLMSNKSGHYQPGAPQFRQWLHRLQKSNVKLDFQVTGFGIPAGNTAAQWLATLPEKETHNFEKTETVWAGLQHEFGAVRVAAALAAHPGHPWGTNAHGLVEDTVTHVQISHKEVRNYLEAYFGKKARTKVTQMPSHGSFASPTISWT